MLVRQKDQVIGLIQKENNTFHAWHYNNWFASQGSWIGTFETFQEAKKAITKYNKGGK